MGNIVFTFTEEATENPQKRNLQMHHEVETNVFIPHANKIFVYLDFYYLLCRKGYSEPHPALSPKFRNKAQ